MKLCGPLVGDLDTVLGIPLSLLSGFVPVISSLLALLDGSLALLNGILALLNPFLDVLALLGVIGQFLGVLVGSFHVIPGGSLRGKSVV